MTGYSTQAKRQNKQKKPMKSNLVAQNRRARFNYIIEKEIVCGIVLLGWEVKSLRAGKAQLTDAHIKIRHGEALLIGSNIHPLNTVSTHTQPDTTRTRKLLLHRKELNQLTGLIEQKGYTLVALNLHISKGKFKLKIGVAKGKKQFDKRQTIKERDWQRSEGRQLKQQKYE